VVGRKEGGRRRGEDGVWRYPFSVTFGLTMFAHTPLNLILSIHRWPHYSRVLLANVAITRFQYLLLSYTDHRPSGTAPGTRRTSKSQLFRKPVPTV
jgi:hypothetical protein